MFHRRELGKSTLLDIRALSLCYKCDYDLRLTPAQKLWSYEQSAAELASDTTGWLENAAPAAREVSYYTVLHQICKLLISKTWGQHLRDFAMGQLGLDFSSELAAEGSSINRAFFEHRTIAERHHILHIAYWLLAD